jgi:hypothetical protein
MRKLLFGTLLVIFSGCSKHAPYYYRFTSVSLTNVDNTGETGVVNADSVSGKAYRIYTDFTAHVMRIGGGLDNANEASYINENKVTGISIYCLQVFDSVHAPLNSLNDYFLYGMSNSKTIGNMISSEEFSHTAQRQNPKEDWIENRSFFLMHPPGSAGTYSFVMKFDFEDGFSISDTTSVYLY